ncbi:MAG TPA: UPF0182 family protein [Gemmatimonadaceae bacterium]|nr:UPF0182 family protein [Gemmatimonadaceae bacterium]
MRLGRQLALAAAVLAALLLAGRLLAAVWADHAWYAALGAGELWWAKAGNVVLLHGGSALLGAAIVFANLYAVRQSVATLVLPRRVGNLEIGEEVSSTYMAVAIGLLSLLVGAALAFAQADWSTLALARVVDSFGEIDPYLGRDLSFYVGWLPLERSLFVWAQVTLIVVTGLVVALYALTPSLRWEGGRLLVSPRVRRHFTVLGALLLLLLAWSYRLDRYLLLVDGGSGPGLYGWVDDQVAGPSAMVLAVLTTAAAVLVLWAGLTAQVRMAFTVVSAVLVLALLLQEALPAAAPRLVDGPSLDVRNRSYLGTREIYTRRAYAAEGVRTGDSAAAFVALDSAIDAVPLWDPGAVAATLQRAGPAATVVGNVGWRMGPEGLLAMAVLREPLADSSLRWSLGTAAATRTEDSGPVRDGLPVTETPLPAPLVYDGAVGDLVLADTTGIVAAPPLTGAASRLLHAWSVQRLRLAVGQLPAPTPRLVRHRGVRERVARLAPVFVQGAVTPIALDDTVYWTVPLYAASRTYPLSFHLTAAGREWTYFKHAGTALVHSRTGRVAIVPVARPEALTRRWIARFPSLFTTWEQLPADLAAAVPPPLDGAATQASAFARVGTADVRPPPWHLAPGYEADSALGDFGATLMGPSSNGGTAPMWTVAMVDEADRVVGAVAATGGAHPSTTFVASASPGERWLTVRERLRRPPDQAAALPTESRLVGGRVRTVPTRQGIAFVQPFYAWRSQGAPGLSRVAMLTADSLSYGATFADAVRQARGGPALPELGPTDFRGRVAAIYARMRGALRIGDWSAFGAAFDELGRLLAAPR